MLNGVEPTATRTIGTMIPSTAVDVQNCTGVRLAVNGAATRPADPTQLPRLFSQQRDTIIDVLLENTFDSQAQPIHQSYRLRFRVADAPTLAAVDTAFRKLLAVDAVDFGAVDQFLSHPDSLGLASDYAAALATYVRGALVKDRPTQAAVTLPYAHYRALYTESLLSLTPFRRPLAGLVCALIRFALNDFSVQPPAGIVQLEGAWAHLAPLAGTPVPSTLPARRVKGAGAIPVCPMDDGVSRVLNLWQRLQERPIWSPALEEECRQTATATSLDSADREKATALWAAAALQASPDAAAEPLRLLSAIYPFDRWASTERERSAP